MMRSTVSIKFTDMPPEFNCYENYITRALRANCDILFSDNPDFVFYSNFGTEFTTYKSAVKICISGEPVLPNFNDCDYAIDYHNLYYGDRHFRAGGLIGNVGQPILPELQMRADVSPAMTNRKFCNFVYSNERNGEGAKLRKDFCLLLSQYKPVDCPGTVLHNLDNALEKRYAIDKTGARVVSNEDWVATKVNFLRQYKFTIAFENTALSGYTTEKLYHPIQAYSIPIYWGDPDVCQHFNPNAFINANDYIGNFEALVARIIELDTDNEKYMNMLQAPPFCTNYPFDEGQRLSQFLATIIEKGPHPYEKNVMGFTEASTMSFEEHCRLGHVGMRTIVKYLNGWLQYKVHRKG